MLNAPVHLGTMSKSATKGPVNLPATRREIFSSTEKTKKMVTPCRPNSRKVPRFRVLIKDPPLRLFLSAGYLGSAPVQRVSRIF